MQTTLANSGWQLLAHTSKGEIDGSTIGMTSRINQWDTDSTPAMEQVVEDTRSVISVKHMAFQSALEACGATDVRRVRTFVKVKVSVVVKGRV